MIMRTTLRLGRHLQASAAASTSGSSGHHLAAQHHLHGASLRWQQQRCGYGFTPSGRSSTAAPGRTPTRRGALENYLVDKLTAVESTFKELQLRMADPDVVGKSDEYQKVAKAAGELEQTVTAFRQYQSTEQQVAEAEKYLREEAASDPEMAQFAREEIAELNKSLQVRPHGEGPPSVATFVVR